MANTERCLGVFLCTDGFLSSAQDYHRASRGDSALPRRLDAADWQSEQSTEQSLKQSFLTVLISKSPEIFAKADDC